MRDWVIILILYALVLGLFRVLGGFAGAGEAFRQWGAHSSTPRIEPGSSG